MIDGPPEAGVAHATRPREAKPLERLFAGESCDRGYHVASVYAFVNLFDAHRYDEGNP